MTVATVSKVRFEHLDEPLGIGTATPRLSWKTAASAGWHQRGWQVEASRTDGTILASGNNAEQVLVAWPFEPLKSRERVDVRVRVHGADGEWSAWSENATVEAGLLNPQDWSALPVGGAWEEQPGTERRPARVRTSFSTREDVVRARLYVTAHGLYEAEINGVRVGDHELSPGWTSYESKLLYWTFDVTNLVAPGQNVIGAWMADGWYRGRLGFGGGHRDVYGNDQALIAQLEVHYADGAVDTVATGPDWVASLSPILESSLYDGEKHDARVDELGWSSPGAPAAGWTPVAVGHRDPATLQAPTLPPIRCTAELEPVEVRRIDEDTQLIDFGQNLVGRVRVRVEGAAGHIVALRHAEVLEHGELGIRPLRLADARDVLTLDGGAMRYWEPRFTFHGFRYATISGVRDVEPGDVVARVLHNDMRRTGWFESSSADLNRLHENVRWGMRGNFLSIPTDCPQRDERLGWTGDIQVFAPTASFLYDSAGFLGNWLTDVASEQHADGTVPWFVPEIPGGEMWTPADTGAVWGDVAVLTPWTLHERYGDRGVLERQYDSARSWVERMVAQAGPARLWKSAQQLGDWLDPDAPPHDPADAKTDRYLVASAYFAHSTAVLGKIARLLGRDADSDRYERIAAEARDAFRVEYGRADGRLASDAQTAYALAIRFGLLSASETAAAGERLAELVREAGNRISTGFAGTPVISDALSATGHLDTAYDLLLEDSCPSWLYTVRMGGTTIWERWDSMLPDGTINPGEMTSFNHYALGSVADWMHRVIGGLRPAAPGYRSVIWEPQPGGDLSAARVVHESAYGTIEAAWHREGEHVRFSLSVPTGVDGTIRLPGYAEEIAIVSGERFELVVADS